MSDNATIYKLMTRTDWEAAQAAGIYSGSEHDLRDGFIHFSTAAQLQETARKHFNGVNDLVLLAVDASVLDEPQGSLKWEPSRGGDLFPHLYGKLVLSAVMRVSFLPLGADGVPIVPKDLS